MTTELRHCERFSSKEDVIVALLYPPEESEDNLIGPLLDISRSGLAFSYSPLDTARTSAGKYCKVSLLKPPMMIPQILCKIVYDIESHDNAMFLPAPKRVGLEFLSPLSDSDLDAIVSE